MANANFTCVLDAWNDGKVLYGRMHYYRSGSYYYSDSSFPDPTMDLGGVSYTDTAFGNRVRSGIYVGDVYSTTFSRTVGGSGSRTVTWTAGSGQRSDFAGTWSKSVTIPASYTPPTGLSVSVAEVYSDGAKFNVSVSSYGNPSSASGRFIEAGIAGQNSWVSPSLRSAIASNVTSAQIVVNNQSTKTTTLNIKPNTQYYYGGYAWNTQQEARTIAGQFVTLPASATISQSGTTATTATFIYGTEADGGHYNKTIEYSLDNGTTWTTAATITSGAEAAGYFTVSGLTEGDTYTLKTRVTTTAGSSNNTDITFTAEPGAVKDRIYGGVAGEGLTGVTGEVRTGGSGNITAFEGSTFWATAIEDSGFKTRIEAGKLPSYLEIGSTIATNYWYCDVVFNDNTRYTISDQDNTPPGPYTTAELGLTANFTVDGTDYVDLTPVYSTVGRSRLINDLYGRGGNVTGFTGEINPKTTAQYAGNITAFNSATFYTALQAAMPTFRSQGYRFDISEVTSVVVEAYEPSEAPGTLVWALFLYLYDGLDVFWEEYDPVDNPINLSDYGITATISQRGNDEVVLTPIFSNYGSKIVNKLYGPIQTQGIASFNGTIRSGSQYIGNVTAFDGSTFWDAVVKEYPSIVKTVEENFNPSHSYVEVWVDESDSGVKDWGVQLIVTLDPNTAPYYDIPITRNGYPFTAESLGITMPSTNVGIDIIDLTATEGIVIRARLINQGFGHHIAPKYGRVYYKVDPTDQDSPIRTVVLQNKAEFDSLCGNSSPWTASIGGGSVTVSNNSANAIIGIEIGTDITAIGDKFLYSCEYFNSPMVVPDNVISIGRDFMTGNTMFNQPLVLSNNLETIGNSFLRWCTQFNQPISLPSSLTSIGWTFMTGTGSMVSTINVGALSDSVIASDDGSFGVNDPTDASYAQGIPIAGANRAAWIAKFPIRNVSLYRKLLDAGS